MSDSLCVCGDLKSQHGDDGKCYKCRGCVGFQELKGVVSVPTTERRREQTANERQVGGSHYKGVEFEVWDAWWLWDLNPFQATIIKHVARYKKKNNLEDLEKARHYLDKLIELEKGR